MMHRGVSVRSQNSSKIWRRQNTLAPSYMIGLLYLALALVVPGAGRAQPAQPAPAPSAAPSPGGAPAAPTADAGANTVRLHDLERKVDELKEQIFRSKARLNLLKETVLHGVIAGARAVIVHRNEMGVLYQPIRIVYALDGAEIFGKSDESGKLGDQKEIEVFNGSILPGSHTLSVQIIYQGNGLGVFSYLKGYKFTVRASHSFTVPEGKISSIKVVGYEKGNALTTDPKDRPALDFRSNVSAADAKKAK